MLALGWGPTPCIVGWAAPPGSGSGVTGVSGRGSQKPRFGWGWKLTRTLLSARQFGAIRICGLCFGFLFVCFISFIFELWLKRTLSMWRMLNCLLYDWEQGLIGTRSPRNFFFNYVHWFRLHCVWVPENQEAATESNWHTETHIHSVSSHTQAMQFLGQWDQQPLSHAQTPAQENLKRNFLFKNKVTHMY